MWDGRSWAGTADLSNLGSLAEVQAQALLEKLKCWVSFTWSVVTFSAQTLKRVFILALAGMRKASILESVLFRLGIELLGGGFVILGVGKFVVS